jgi:hypothetical protein
MTRNGFGLTAVLACAFALACVGARRGKCDPVVDKVFLVYGEAFRQCEVDERAELTLAPRINYTGPLEQDCHRTVVEFVVDEHGYPLPETARFSRATPSALGQAILKGLESARYSPAIKSGAPVKQLVAYESLINFRSPVSRGRFAFAGEPTC